MAFTWRYTRVTENRSWCWNERVIHCGEMWNAFSGPKDWTAHQSKHTLLHAKQNMPSFTTHIFRRWFALLIYLYVILSISDNATNVGLTRTRQIKIIYDMYASPNAKRTMFDGIKTSSDGTGWCEVMYYQSIPAFYLDFDIYIDVEAVVLYTMPGKLYNMYQIHHFCRKGDRNTTRSRQAAVI